MAAKIIRKRIKQRRTNVPKAKAAPVGAPSARGHPSSVGAPAVGGHPPSTEEGGANANPAASKTHALISQLTEHDEQGRIFDALAVVRELRDLEGEDPSLSPALDPVRHLMEEVVSQAGHVESLLHELHSDDDWTLAKQKSGVTVHYRREADSPIHTVRACTVFSDFSPKDFVRLCSLFVETECMHLWFPNGVMKPASVLSWHSKYTKVIQLRISLGLPMIASRDAIVQGNGYHLPDRNAFLISTKTILDDVCRYCDIPKPEKGVVRMATESIFYVELVKRDVISFKMIGRDDLKLKYMPSSVLNYLSQGHLPMDLMKTIHRTIRNFRGSVWEEKIEERGEYYTEIEDKVYEQLEKWDAGGGGTKSVQIKEVPCNNRKVGFDMSTGVEHAEKTPGQENVFVVDKDERRGNKTRLFAWAAAVLCALAAAICCSTGQPTILNETETAKWIFAGIVSLLILLGLGPTSSNQVAEPQPETCPVANTVECNTISNGGAKTASKDDGRDECKSTPSSNDTPCQNRAKSIDVIEGACKTMPSQSPEDDASRNPTASKHPPSTPRKKLKNVGSTVNAGFHRVKSMPSLRVLSGKRNAANKTHA